MRSKVVLIAVCLLSAAEAQVPWGGESERSRAQVYALEGLGALGGSVGCSCVGAGVVGLLGWAGGVFNSDDEWAILGLVTIASPVLSVTAAVLPAATAYCAIRAGDQLGENGSEGRAYGGAYLGAVVGIGLVALGSCVGTLTRDFVGMPFYVVGGLAIPIGAVVGYNRGATSRSDFGSRLQPPAVALTSVELPDHSVEYGVKFQLAGLKF
jgi:hypothetical protein